jgi:inner membrane protein
MKGQEERQRKEKLKGREEEKKTESKISNPMQGFNHIAGGMVFTVLFASFHDVNVFERPEYIAVVVGAALLPDIDHTRSLIGKMVYPLAKWISLKFGHRTITHSLAFYLGVLFVVKLLEILYGQNSNTYSILVTYALLSHLVFDMCTRQGIPFFYPFSSRPCVIPGNPAMRLRTADLKSEAVIFILFCSLILFCWPLFGAGFWQKYNETFMNYSHVQREAKRKDDILQITFVNANKDTVTANLIDFKENTFVTHNERNGFASFPAKACTFVSFKHTSIPLRTTSFQVFNVSIDSIKHYLKKPLVKLQLQATTEMYYYEGAVLNSGKTVTKDYVENFDFFIEEPDFSEQEAEIKNLTAELTQEDQMFRQEQSDLQSERAYLQQKLTTGNRNYPRLSEYQKGEWIKERPKLKADIQRLFEQISHLHNPSHQADYQRIKNLKAAIKRQKVLVSGNFVMLN